MEFITTFLDQLKVDTPLKSLDGDTKTVWTTGYVLTHGEPAGDLTDSSRSNKVIAALTALSMLVHQMLEKASPSEHRNTEESKIEYQSLI